MKKNVTMKYLAESLNISIVTVSKALNNKEGVSEELRKKIKDLANYMGYKSNNSTKNIKDKPTHNIGVIVSKRFLGKDSFYLQIYQHITTVLQEQSYYAILEVIDYENEKNNTLPKLYNDNRVDAIVILGYMEKSYIKSLKSMDIPFIFLDYYDSDYDTDSVNNDNYYASYEITSYLIKQGHKDIGFIGNIYTTNTIQDRFLGYCKALIENKISINYEWTISDINEDGSYISIELPVNLPTAFVCNCDKVAFNFVQLLNKKGLSVPNDCSIVSFDNDLYSTICNPKLTSIEADKEAMARKAVDLILDKLKDKEKNVERVLIKSRIIKRDSVKSI